MDENNSAFEKIENFFWVGLSGSSFWIFYFSYFVIMRITAIFYGSICNLGLINDKLCRVNETSLPNYWQGANSFSPVMNLSMFFLFFILMTAFKNQSSKKEYSHDSFDIIIKIFSIFLLAFKIFDTIVLIILFSAMYSLYRFCLFFYDKFSSKQAVKIKINKKKELIFVILLFALFAFLDLNRVKLYKVTLGKIDEGSLIDCCNDELSFIGFNFSIEKNSLICNYGRNNGQVVGCKMSKPIFNSIFEDYPLSIKDGDTIELEKPETEKSNMPKIVPIN